VVSVPPLSTVLFLAGGLLPRSRRAWKISAISAGRCPRLYIRFLRRYHSQFDRHIRADRRNFKSANECGRGQADRHPEAVTRLRRSFASLPGNHLLRDLDSPAAATATLRHSSVQRLRRTWYIWSLKPLDSIVKLLHLVSINQKKFPHWEFVPRNVIWYLE